MASFSVEGAGSLPSFEERAFSNTEMISLFRREGRRRMEWALAKERRAAMFFFSSSCLFMASVTSIEFHFFRWFYPSGAIHFGATPRGGSRDRRSTPVGEICRKRRKHRERLSRSAGRPGNRGGATDCIEGRKC